MFGRKNKRAEKQRQQAEAFMAIQTARLQSIALLKDSSDKALRLSDPVSQLIALEVIKEQAKLMNEEVQDINVKAPGLIGGTIIGTIAGTAAAALLVSNPLTLGITVITWGVFGGGAGLVAGIPFDFHRMQRQTKQLQTENADFIKQLNEIITQTETAQAQILKTTGRGRLLASPLVNEGLKSVPALKEHFQIVSRNQKDKKRDKKHGGPKF